MVSFYLVSLVIEHCIIGETLLITSNSAFLGAFYSNDKKYFLYWNRTGYSAINVKVECWDHYDLFDWIKKTWMSSFVRFRSKKEETKQVKIFGTDLSDLYNITNERGAFHKSLKMGHSRPLFRLFSFFPYWNNNYSFDFNNINWWKH